jgi:protein involved in polysaccharide export with SLBB domain
MTTRLWLIASAVLLSIAAPGISRAQDKPAPSFSISIEGQVGSPGKYTITSDFSVIDAIEMAGGFTAQALRSSVAIARTVEDGGAPKKTVIRLDYSDYPLNNANADFKLQPGDVISVPVDPTYGK